jgi:hypothetical protein
MAGTGCRPVFSAVALLALLFPEVHAQTFDWSEVPPIHPGVQHALIATNVISALPENNQWRYINVLRIDLSEPSLRFHTTPRAALWGEPMPDGPIDGLKFPGFFVRTERQSNWNFIQQARAGGTNMIASINAAPWTPWNPAHELYADRLGLAVSAGVLVSEANGSPSLVFDRNWTGRLQTSHAGADISEVELAVSGFEYVLSSGTVIATGTTPQPRTGYGISQDGRYLYWMTVDGRINLVIAGASRYLSGASHQEVGLLLQYLGAWDGLNMDGGYSTQMTTWDGGSGQLVQRAMTAGTNVTQHRRVANNLGLYLDTRPPVPSVTPVSLHRTLPRGAAETATLEVRNTGGGALDCTVSSDVPWVEVPGESFSVKGRHLLDVRIDSDGLPPGTHSARITVRHGGQPAEESVVTLTLDVPSTPRLPEDLPLVESFESLPEGHWLPGTAGWIGNYTAAQVRGELYSAVEPPGPPLPLASRTRVARLTCGVTRRVLASEGQPIKVDLMKQFASRGLTVPEEMSPEWQAAFGVDHAGELHLWHRDHDGNGWAPRWTALGQPALATEEWVRLSVDFDYTTSPHGDAFFRPRINGSMVPTARGFRAPDDLRSPGPWYMTANSPGQGGGNGPRRLAALDFAGRGAVDDLVIRDAAEATAIYPEWMGFAHRGAVQRDGVPLAWFDRWGLRRDPAAPVAGYDRTARQAFLTGTDPLDPDGKFRVLRHWMSDGRFHVEIMGNDSGAAAPYIMRGTTNLADGIWEDVWPVPRAAAPANTTIWSHEMPADRSSYFYRIEAVEEGSP